MLDPTQLDAFVAVIRAGSFTKAADALGTDKARVSRLVSRLEDHLSAQLLVRSTRSLSVTEIGREVYERAVGVIAAMEETQAVVAATNAAPTGLLRLTCGEEFGQFVVTRWLPAYALQFPEVRIDAHFTNRVVDLVHEGFDVAIRVGPLPDSGLVARKLGEIQYALYASTNLLAEKGNLSSVDDLASWPTILFTGGGTTRLRLTRGQEEFELAAAPRIAVNNNAAARQLVLRGLGIGLLPRFQADPIAAEGHLVEVLHGWVRPPVPVHAVYASSRFLTPKVRTFVDLARREFDQSLAAIAT